MFSIMPDKPSKKYPVIYEGKEYKVQWKINFLEDEIVSVYEVYSKRGFFTQKEHKKCRKIYSVSSCDIARECSRLNLPINREYKYIMYINVLMAMMMTAKGAEIKAKQLERQSLDTLKNWDGNLDTWSSKNI